METEYTPGPWYVNLQAGEGKEICSEGSHGHECVGRVHDAKNANMIAAAPELLDACRKVLDIINAYSHIPAQFKACEILQKAIGKAEGRE